ncbi:RRQRL motif-containing zinc-binding protein [Nocardia vulneris]|uniref:RRQRL motif-containing zinc-binding protein n=1 Tax=Nocardia vulneris TaxID=1141657 RepID=UPI00068CCBB1|nr:RRQRL motif-containing zinc-binding protein [Nocardia vulneris]
MSGFLDPDGARHGLPTWPWGLAPQHLRTRRQLAADGRRPGGESEGQVLRARGGSRGPLKAYLYDADSAVPKRVPSDAQLEALRLARWTRSVDACERRGIDASDMREVIEQARADIAAQRAARPTPRSGRERSR